MAVIQAGHRRPHPTQIILANSESWTYMTSASYYIAFGETLLSPLKTYTQLRECEWRSRVRLSVQQESFCSATLSVEGHPPTTPSPCTGQHGKETEHAYSQPERDKRTKRV
eukprot:CAMPEP_0119376252 /NCGR_PEP_ID=MMETSP1334-20130426/39784_1 /TAXON_ID=127549 /ORGANISM="Calcidiscus leptoporus, Strain RCC1130" /LENGTH=110 /DNA_ID=CAMNT_0007394781 /DNA_START=138 /DNA_END=466 /DNA_ORIENTATION=+